MRLSRLVLALLLFGYTDQPLAPSAPTKVTSATPRLVIAGDSRAMANALYGDPWANMAFPAAYQPYTVVNLSMGGLLHDYATFRDSELVAAYTSELCWLVIEAAGNDLVLGRAPNDIYNDAIFLTQQAHAAHVRVVIGTWLPAAPTNGIGPTFDSVRVVYNDLVIANRAGADAIAFLDRDTIMGPIAAAYDTTLYYDGHHYALKGNQIVTPIWTNAIMASYH